MFVYTSLIKSNLTFLVAFVVLVSMLLLSMQLAYSLTSILKLGTFVLSAFYFIAKVYFLVFASANGATVKQAKRKSNHSSPQYAPKIKLKNTPGKRPMGCVTLNKQTYESNSNGQARKSSPTSASNVALEHKLSQTSTARWSAPIQPKAEPITASNGKKKSQLLSQNQQPHKSSATFLRGVLKVLLTLFSFVDSVFNLIFQSIGYLFQLCLVVVIFSFYFLRSQPHFWWRLLKACKLAS